MQLTFFSSAFCEPCLQTRSVLAEVERLVPAVTVRELDVARDNAEAEAAGIRNTPTILVRDAAGDEVFRAAGVPAVAQVLTALAHAL